MIRPILVVGNPVLRQKAKRVTQIDRPIQRLIDDMIETMQAAPGVGLAAPQIGIPLRLAVIEVEEELDEGCLSVPGFWGRLQRAQRVSVKALDRNGKEQRIRDAEGLFAQALQHEIDHLDGHLYIDRMGSLDKLQRSEPIRKREADARRARGEDGEDVEDIEDEEEEPE
jgi:peptide deformylase